MLKVLLLCVLAFGFVACDEDDLLDLVEGDAIALPEGNYTSACTVDGSTSFISAVEIQSQTTVVIQDTLYTDTECMTVDSMDSAETLTIAVADFSFAGKVSYFHTIGEDVTTAYYIEDGLIYITDPQEGVTEDNAASVFADFVASPKENAGTVLTPVTI